MGYQIKQSTTAYPLVFLMVDSTDHVTAKTGLSPTVTISKAGGSFASPSGAVTEIANGWYKVAGNATDSATLGPLILHATGTAADPVDIIFEVVAFDPQDSVRLGLTAMPNAAAAASGGLLISGSNSGTTTLGALTVTGATTLTGAVSATNASNDLRINGAVPGASGGIFIAGTNAATTVTTSFTTTFTGNLTGSVGSVTGAVGSVTGAVGSVTGNVGGNVTGSVGSVTGAVGSVTGNVGGNVTGSVGSIATGGITTASFFAGATIPRCTLTDTITTYTGNTVQTGDNYARLASYASTYFSPTSGYAASLNNAYILESSSLQSGISTSTTIALNAAGASSSNSAYINCGVTWGTESRTITAYNGTTKVATVNRAWVTTPTSGTYYIIGEQTAPLDVAGKFTNDTAQGTDLTAVASDVDTIYTYVITTGVALSAATKNSIADHVRRRTQANVEASADGDTLSHRSLYGFIQQAQKSNTTANANKITIYKLDGTTELGQLTIATDPAADPNTGVS